MAKFRIPYQNLEFDIPDIGEVFYQPDQGMIYRREGNTLRAISLQSLGYDALGGDTASKAKQAQTGEGISFNQSLARGMEIFKQQTGVDVGTLPVRTGASFADTISVFERTSGFKIEGTQNALLFKPTEVKTGEIITQNISASNPHGVDVTSSASGSIAKSPSLQENIQRGIDYNNANPGSGLTNTDIEKLRTDPSLAVSGRYARTINGAIIDTTTGNVVGATKDLSSTIRSTNTASDDELKKLLASSGLSSDEQKAIQAYYDAISTYDNEAAARFSKALDAGTKLADPYFRQKIRLVQDELTTVFADLDKDLEYSIGVKERALKNLKEDFDSQKGYLGLEEQQQLKDLETKYTQELETARNNAAATGFTHSTRRAKTEEVLAESKGDLVESTKRQFGAKLGSLERNVNQSTTDTASEIARLQEITTGKKQSTYRAAEEKLGTGGLPNLRNMTPLGSITGSIEEARLKDILGFAKSFVF